MILWNPLWKPRPEEQTGSSFAIISLKEEQLPVPEQYGWPGKKLSIGLQVIIRPRGGDFCYSDVEMEVMKQDVVTARELGADGVVIGILQPDGRVDKERCAELIELAGDIECYLSQGF